MIKKVWLFFLSAISIFWFWVSFANPIAPEIDYVCSMFENVEIDNYKVVVGIDTNEPMMPATGEYEEPQRIFWWMTHTKKNFYEPRTNECICGNYSYNSNFMEGDVAKIFLLDKSIDIENITEDEIEIAGTSLWLITTTCKHYDKIQTYKIINNWNQYELIRGKTVNIKDKKEFPFFWLWTVILEILVLFYIAKLFRKENQISNKRLLLFWIIPTTVTLPLLWFVLPLFIWDWPLYIIVWELLVMVLEAIIIKYWLKISRWKAIITSIICNLFSLLVLSFGYDILSSEIFSSTILSLILLVLLYSSIRAIILCFILRLSPKNDEISNKRIILVWILSPIISIIASLLLIFITSYFNLWNLLLFIAIWIYLVLELVILEYWLKISRKKACALFIQSILFFIIILFIIAVCSEI